MNRQVSSLLIDEAEFFLKRAWRIARFSDEQSLIGWDAKSEFLGKVPFAHLEGLARRRFADAELEEALGQLRQLRHEGKCESLVESQPDYARSHYPYALLLNLLGTYILVRCRYRECRADVSRYFAPAVVTEAWCSPDVVVWCDWHRGGRWLFRARPAEEDASQILAGVRVWFPGSPEPSQWVSRNPPLPPYDADPLRERFIGLHAAAVKIPDGSGLIAAGHRRAGKTSVAVALVKDHGCGLLTEETAFIHRRTRMVEPFPREVGLKESHTSIEKMRYPADQIFEAIEREPILAKFIFFLAPGDGIRGLELRELSASQTFRMLLDHHLDMGCSGDEAMVTVMQLANAVRGFECRYSSYEELLRIAPRMMAAVYDTAGSP